MQLHAHVVDGGVGVQHLVLVALALVDDHHVGAALDLGERGGDTGHLLAEVLVQGEQVVDLRVEGRLVGAVLGERRGRRAELGGGVIGVKVVSNRK